MNRSLANLLLVNLTWLGCVVSASRGHDVLALAVVAAHLVVHFRWIAQSRAEAVFPLAAAVLGVVVDTILSLQGVIRFPHHSASAGLVPLWMTALWVNLGTAMPHSLRWAASRPALAAFAGALGGPAAYLAGARLGALSVDTSSTGLMALALAWAAALPATPVLSGLLCSKRTDPHSTGDSPA